MLNIQLVILGDNMLKDSEIKVVKNDTQYRKYLEVIERLVIGDPHSETPEGARLELLAKLVSDYEKARYVFQVPDPIDVIQFKMEERGLKQKDLAELLGGKNRVSEVLSRKRSLTLSMIRSLNRYLDIPVELLIREPEPEQISNFEISKDDLPYETMVSRGWIEDSVSPSEVIKRYFYSSIGSPVFLRNTLTFGVSPKTNFTRIWLWLSRVKELARASIPKIGKFSHGSLDMDFLKYVARLSWMDNGPRNAIDFLSERGIVVIIEPKLPGTRVDGAALIGSNGAPVIALTLQHDRIDNFWFTLMHELVHAWKHLDPHSFDTIVDEEVEKAKDTEAKEAEANEIANEALFSRAVWRRSDAFRNPNVKNIKALAAEQQIHPAIIAGRVRYERNNYKLFSSLVGYRQVRQLFPEIDWI